MQDLADVDEADIGQVKDGQEASFTVDAYPYDTFKGIVAQVRLQAVNVQNVNNYTVVINVANKDLRLLPGLTATTTIETQRHTNVIRLPANAIHFMPPITYLTHIKLPESMYQNLQIYKVAGNEIPKPGSECYIWVKTGDLLSPVLIKTGIFDGTYLEVSGDIKPGDEVVTGIDLVHASGTTAKNPFMPQIHPAGNAGKK